MHRSNPTFLTCCISVIFLVTTLQSRVCTVVDGFSAPIRSSVGTTGTSTKFGSGAHVEGRRSLSQPFARPSVRNLAQDSDNDKVNSNAQYSRDLYLREEVESPFRKVRFFVYASLAGGAATSLAVSLARVAAASLAGINTELQSESLWNAAVDVAGLAVLAFLFQRDLQAQESRLQRASKGAALAKLLVRGAKRWMVPDASGEPSSSGEAWTTSLSSLRRGRGMEKRVVIAVGGPDRIDRTIQDALRLQDTLAASDLLVVPVVLPQGQAPLRLDASQLPDCLALPVGNSWKTVVQDEAEQATVQGVNVAEDGFCVILKKNGKIGQRTKGINLSRMAGEVEERKELGMDVTNI